jgi:hypothetical protein
MFYGHAGRHFVAMQQNDRVLIDLAQMPTPMPMQTPTFSFHQPQMAPPFFAGSCPEA